MAMFMAPQSGSQTNTYAAKSFYEVNYQFLNYNSAPQDVITSSLASYLPYGYDYNFTSPDITAEFAKGNMKPLESLKDLKPTSPGVFNLPVCVITNLIYIPGCTISDWPNHGGWDPCITQPGICQSAKWTGPDGSVQYFKDHVSKNLCDLLANAKGYQDNSGGIIWTRDEEQSVQIRTPRGSRNALDEN